MSRSITESLSFFQHMKIRTKLFLLIIFTIGGLGFFAILTVFSLQSTNRLDKASGTLMVLNQLGSSIAPLVHELQVEKALAAGVIGGKDKGFEAEFSKQLAVTKQAQAAFDDIRKLSDVAAFIDSVDSVSEQFSQAEASLAALDKLRPRLAERGNSPDQLLAVLKSYEDATTRLLALAGSTGSFSRDIGSAKALAAVVSIAQAKQSLSRAIALVNYTLAAGNVADSAIQDELKATRAALRETELFLRVQVPADATDAFLKLVTTAPGSMEDRILKTAGGAVVEGADTVTAWWNQSRDRFAKAAEVQRGQVELLASTSQSAANRSLYTATTLAGVVLVVVLLASLVAFATFSSITKQVNSITDLLAQISIGNFAARAEVLSSDELGAVATSLNAMLDNTLRLIQSEQERDAIQSSIKKLLDEVSGVASGDLTVEAEVTADFTGAIADSFNFMISQLREIVSNVQDATLQVSSSANQIQSTTEHLSRGSELQASQIVQTSAAIDEIAKSIQLVAHNSAESAEVAEEARRIAKRGTEAVQATIMGMDRIRNQVQETAKRIKRLGESSQEVGEITQLIGDIADRTSILALNASIQAAMAGEAGQGFAVVAEEVERLAERANAATKQIATLIKTIQNDTNEAVSAMEESTREVVEGSKLATQAGGLLTEIERTSDRQAELIRTISQTTKEQSRGSDELSRAMSEISEVTQTTASGTKQAAASVSRLAALADELRASVSTFKLPTANGDMGGSTIFRRFQNLSDSRV